MKITFNRDDFTLHGVNILDDKTVTLTLNQMWQIYEHMKRLNIKTQIINFIDLRKDDPDYFEDFERTAEDMLNDDDMLSMCVDDIINGNFDFIEDDWMYRLLERYVQYERKINLND